MAEPLSQSSPPASIGLQPLQPGQRLDQATFHPLYQAASDDFHAELIGGIVYLPSPDRHSKLHSRIVSWLEQFELGSPVAEALLTPSVILGDRSEPEPDALLRIIPAYGGKTRDVEGYVTGQPELLVEVSLTTAAFDLHQKKADYQAAGVDEYLVLLAQEERIAWFALRDGAYRPLEPESSGIYHSQIFPGLWLDPGALFSGKMRRVQSVLRQGLGSPEHADWLRDRGL